METQSIEIALRAPLPISSSTLSLSSNTTSSVLDTGSIIHAPVSHSAPSVLDAIPMSRNVNESSLPPADKGIDAWIFLAGAFVVEAIVWGFPNSFGVLLDAYLSDSTYASQPHASTLLPLIGPVASGIIYCSAFLFRTGPFVTPIITRYPHHRRTCLYIGVIICWASLFSASYTTRLMQLVALQGGLYAVGGSLLYLTCISYLNEWFILRRGFANGVIFAGTGVGGVLLPLILPSLLSAYGPPKTLRILAISIAALILPLLPFIKGRLPVSRGMRIHGPTPRGREWSKSKSFWVLVVANTFQGFGYFVPIVWLPTFAGELHLTGSASSIALVLLNCGSVLGRLSMGYLSDKMNPWLLGFLTLISTSAATFILWGVLSYNLAGLLSFSLVYGILAGGWTSSWTGFTRPLSANDPTLSTTLFGVLLFFRGMGNIFSTPISSALSSHSSNSTSGSPSSPPIDAHLGFHVAGGRFEKMILYVGTCFAGAALIVLVGWAVDIMQRRNNDSERRSRITREFEAQG